MKTEITQIKIKLKDKTVELSADEAQQVFHELEALFGMSEQSKIKEYVPIPCWPYVPIIVDSPTWPKRWEITCGTSAGQMPQPATVCMTLT